MALNSFEGQIARIRQLLENGLPGSRAHSIMAPAHRDRLIRNSRGPKFARKSGVLILLFPGNQQELNTVFIKRMEYKGVHSGQIAFPGGKYEDTDPDIVATAVREAEEEIGISGQSLRIVGQLSDLFVPPSNFIISPVLAGILQKPGFIPDKTEVAEVFTLPLDHFLQPENSGTYDLKVDGSQSITVPGYRYGDHLIWGATAMILSELLTIYRQATGY